MSCLFFAQDASQVYFFLLVEERNKCCLGLRITNAKLNAAGCKHWDNLVPASPVLQFAAKYRRSCQWHDLTG